MEANWVKTFSKADESRPQNKKTPFVHIGGYVNWYRHCQKQQENLFKRVKIELSYDPG